MSPPQSPEAAALVEFARAQLKRAPLPQKAIPPNPAERSALPFWIRNVSKNLL
jgi:hypothetical protein